MFAKKIVFWHETAPEKSSRADIWCARLQIALHVFFVSFATLGLRRFGGRANPCVFTHQQRAVPGHVWLPHRSS